MFIIFSFFGFPFLFLFFYFLRPDPPPATRYPSPATRHPSPAEKSCRVRGIEMSCPWLENRGSKDFEKTTKYSQLRLELTNRYREYKVNQYNHRLPKLTLRGKGVM